MGKDTEKFENVMGKFNKKAAQERESADLNLISELKKYSKNEIPRELMALVNEQEYVTSRKWRARDVADLVFRAVLGDYYYPLEYRTLKGAA